jgi:hypothetical protein
MAALAVWLAVLTLVVLLLVRQVSLLTVRYALPAGRVDVDADGVEVGTPLPAAVAALFPADVQERGSVIALSAGCVPCIEVVARLKSVKIHWPCVAIVSGPQEEAAELARLLPPEVEHVLDPIAGRIASALELRSAPFAIAVTNGVVAGKRYLREARDLAALERESLAVPERRLVNVG